MKNLLTLQNGQQLFENYTTEDHEVWSLMYQRQQENLAQHFSSHYKGCLKTVGLDDGKVPNFNSINAVLNSTTGWSLSGVREIVDIEEFLELMMQKSFPATTWVRGMAQLDYLEEPDMFHDVFGHVPLLSNEQFAGFLHALGQIGTEFRHSPQALIMVQRVYWFTVEFGLINENGIKAYGAGIISSPGEVQNFLSGESIKKEFDIWEIMNTDFRTDIFQPIYFVIESLEQLFESVEQVRELIEESVTVS